MLLTPLPQEQALASYSLIMLPNAELSLDLVALIMLMPQQKIIL